MEMRSIEAARFASPVIFPISIQTENQKLFSSAIAPNMHINFPASFMLVAFHQKEAREEDEAVLI